MAAMEALWPKPVVVVPRPTTTRRAAVAVLRAVVVVAAADAARPTVSADVVADSERADDAVPPYAPFAARAGRGCSSTGCSPSAALLPAVLVLLLGPTHDTAVQRRRLATTCTQPTSGTSSVARRAARHRLRRLHCSGTAGAPGAAQSVGQRAAARARRRHAHGRARSAGGGCFGRQLAKLLSLIPLGLGFWWMLWDPRRQTWHDKIAGTIVVRTSDHGEPGAHLTAECCAARARCAHDIGGRAPLPSRSWRSPPSPTT